jgi:hypothetical protein
MLMKLQLHLFGMSSGFVNPTATLDPGLIFNAGYEDYVAFLYNINRSTPLGVSVSIYILNSFEKHQCATKLRGALRNFWALQKISYRGHLQETMFQHLQVAYEGRIFPTN